jgi:hypothetical protein
MDRCNAMVVVSQPPEKPRVIDIFAFHGITGHFQKTWTDKKSGANWLKDFLPIDIPNARVLSVCYDASICCNKVNNLRDISRIILARMVQVRPTENEQQRAIILVSHSLGGLVCKQILITAHELSKEYGQVASKIHGILFFGVPHQGSIIADVSYPIVQTLCCCLPFSISHIRDLRQGSERTEYLIDAWRERYLDLMIYTFYETRTFWGCKVFRTSHPIFVNSRLRIDSLTSSDCL